jgi:iron complex outermembrane receptor protein
MIMKRILRCYFIGFISIFSLSAMAEQDMLSMSLSEFNLPEFDEYSVPVVLTATRLQQHQADVPASVTILDEHFIKQVGAQNLADLLRYVPGMMVGPDNNNNADAVHYHGGPAAFPKNLQVLVNGRSMYRAGVATVSWYEMPVALEDIKRIEVVRGPNSASYGANAFQAVINILTKHPADTYGSSVSLQAGNNGEENIYLKQGGRLGNSDYRLSFTQKRSDQFEADNDGRQSRFMDFEHYYQDSSLGEFETSVVVLDAKKEVGDGFAFQVNKNEISEQRIEIGTRWTKDLSSKHQIQVNAYTTQFKQKQKSIVEDIPVAALDDDLRDLFSQNTALAFGEEQSRKDFYKKVDEAVKKKDPTIFLHYYVGLSAQQKSEIGFNNIFLVSKAYEQDALVDQYLAAYDSITGFSADETNVISAIRNRYDTSSQGINAYTGVNGVINSDLDEYRYDIEIQDTYVYSPTLTFVSGASFRRDEVRSDTYFDGYLKNDTNRLFASATWQATQKANLHLGVMAEQESDADLVFAPRAALNYKLTPSQSLRMVYSESVRSPDLFEQDAYWQLNVENAQASVPLNGTTYFQTQQGPSNLDHQYIRSYEVGYYGRFNRLNSELDIRVFEERLSDVYYQSLTLDDIETINDICMRFQGVEWQYSVSPWSDAQLRWVGAYVDANSNLEGDEASREQVLLRIYAKNTHTISWLQNWNENTSSSVSYILANEYDDLNLERDDRSLIERVDVKVIHSIGLPSSNVELSANVQHDISSDPYIWGDNVYERDTRLQLAARFNF